MNERFNQWYQTLEIGVEVLLQVGCWDLMKDGCVKEHCFDFRIASNYIGTFEHDCCGYGDIKYICSY